jgi:xanthine dehydrogenase large subunit
MTPAPSTYKIPAISDTPAAFDVQLYANENAEPTIFRSKAVGEPPLLLAFSVFLALRDAMAAASPGARSAPPLDAPATAETILMTLERYRVSSDDGTNHAATNSTALAAANSPPAASSASSAI